MPNVILAEKAGFCFGVKRAVEEAYAAKEKYNKKIFTLGPLIHNNDVVLNLKENDIFPIDYEDLEKLNKEDVVIIRSHGVTPQVLHELTKIGVKIINATCPYVSNIQQIAKEYYDKGYKIIIVGDSNHPEVIGINGWCNNSAIISKDGTNLERIPNKVCIISQTTEKQQNWEKVLSKIVKNSKTIAAFNTICNATEVRQQTAEELSSKVDLMVVIGGKESSNTTKLYEICKENCPNTIHVENSGEIPEELYKSSKVKNIGVTAGASTPDWIIKEAVLKMSNDNNMEMNEQLAYMESNDQQVVVGKVVKGEIISVNNKEIYVNLGYKIDGILPRAEVVRDEVTNLPEIYKIGQIIEVKVISRRSEDGYVVLSRIELERESTYKEIKEAFENNIPLQVIFKDSVNGGLVASYKGVRVFIPASHVELFHVNNLEQYLGKTYEVKIIEFNQDRKFTKIVGSRRELLKVERESKEAAAWESLKAGDTIQGEVKRLTDFGAFVDVNGVDGLLHVSEISWGRITKPSDVLKVGDKINVYVIEADKASRKVSLSMKKLIEDPWMNVEVKYPAGSIVLGKVVRFAKFGAFVELEPGVDALVHISQISHKRIEQPSESLEIGQSVKAKIIEVNKENKKISLSIKEVDEI